MCHYVFDIPFLYDLLSSDQACGISVIGAIPRPHRVAVTYGVALHVEVLSQHISYHTLPQSHSSYCDIVDIIAA